MKNTILAVIFLAIAACNQTQTEPTEEQLAEKLQEMESETPERKLQLEEVKLYDAMTGRSYITGKIKNIATATTFKDAVIRVTYFSKTQTIIGEESFTVYEYFKPKESVDFTLKITSPEGRENYSIQVASARNVE